MDQLMLFSLLRSASKEVWQVLTFALIKIINQFPCTKVTTEHLTHQGHILIYVNL